MVLSTATLALLLLACGGAVALAARAIPDGRSPASATINTARALDTLAIDLADAVTVVSSTSTAITFTVPDRTGDALVDTITYAWAGSADAPLSRRFNGGAASMVLDEVREFNLVLDKRSEAGQYYLTGVRVALRAGSNPVARLNTDVRTLNEPAVSGP